MQSGAHLASLAGTAHQLPKKADLLKMLRKLYVLYCGRDARAPERGRPAGKQHREGRKRGEAMPSLLVVDDEVNVLYSLAKSLQSDTLTVFTAQTGREGIELVERQRPDAVILDVRLSDQSGLEVFDRIRQIDPRLPIIIITAFATTETAIEAMKRGAFEYLLKPIDFHQLREVVQRALELSHFRHVPPVFEDAEAVDASDRIVGRSAA